MTGIIPKMVHYCWFGGKPKPSSVERFIQNWRLMLPDYEIFEWNEQNFDVASWPYAQQALDAGKYAFVSDVARLYALYEHGGVYLDTDVEVRRSFDDLLNQEVVLGFEEEHYIATSTILARPRSRLVGDFLKSYESRSFLRSDGAVDQKTNVQVLTSLLLCHGLKRDGSEQDLIWRGECVRILDRVALSPIDYPNGIDYTDKRTYAVHYFGQSWGSPAMKLKSASRRALIGIIGGHRLKRLRVILKSLRS